MRAMSKLKIGNPVLHAKDGVEGFAMLEKLRRPNLVILEINMPRMNGFVRAVSLVENYWKVVEFPESHSAHA
jgi:CheY-like chemotaxis protein